MTRGEGQDEICSHQRGTWRRRNFQTLVASSQATTCPAYLFLRRFWNVQIRFVGTWHNFWWFVWSFDQLFISLYKMVLLQTFKHEEQLFGDIAFSEGKTLARCPRLLSPRLDFSKRRCRWDWVLKKPSSHHHHNHQHHNRYMHHHNHYMHHHNHYMHHHHDHHHQGPFIFTHV